MDLLNTLEFGSVAVSWMVGWSRDHRQTVE